MERRTPFRCAVVLASLLLVFLVLLAAVLFLPDVDIPFIVDEEPTPTPTIAPTPTPFPTPVIAELGEDEVAIIDALGRDIAERRTVEVYEQVAPSVVNITTQILRRGFFFGAIPEEGAGSGFVIDEQGHVLTNYHVIEGAEQIEVSFGEDLSFPAQVVGVDPRNDLAVLQVRKPPDTSDEAWADLLEPVTFGDSTALAVGQRAIAIGNPFGQFDRTLTTGVISALERTLAGRDDRPISGVIQTDAAINRGNSGGPLLDSAGQVIGINTAIFSPTGTSAGVGFAIPSATILRVLPDLLELGYYRHPYLGIRYAYPITPRLADALDLPVETGLLLVRMFEDSPLLRARVRGAQRELTLGNQRVFVGGDILTAVDGNPIASLDDLQLLLENEYRVGDQVTLSLIREGEPFEVQVQLAEEPR